MMMGQQGGMGGYYGSQMNGAGIGAAPGMANVAAGRYGAGGTVPGGAQGGYGGNAYSMGSAYTGRAGGNLPDEDDDVRTANRSFPSGQQAAFMKGGPTAYGQGMPASAMQSSLGRMYGATGAVPQQMTPRGYGGTGTTAYGIHGGNPAALATSKLMASVGGGNSAAVNGGMAMGSRASMGMHSGGNPMMNAAGAMAPGGYRASQGNTTQRTERGYPPY
jgi:hypothetical protein